MGTLINELKLHGASFCLKYYGLQDLATSWDIKYIVENYSVIIQYFEAISFKEIDSIDKAIDYFAACKIVKLRECIPYINTDENIKIVTNVIDRVEVLLENANIGQLIAYINQNIECFFREEYRTYELIDVTLDKILLCQNGITDSVFFYLIENHAYLVIDRYSDFQKIIEKKSILFTALFNVPLFGEILRHRREALLKILASIVKRQKPDQIKQIEPIIDYIIADGKEIATSLSTENIMQFYTELKSTYIFLKQIRSLKANDFEIFMRDADFFMDQYLLSSGKEFTYDISSKEILEMLRKNTDWTFKLLKLTHTVSKESQQIICRLNEPSKGKKGIVDYVSTNIPTDDYYTMTHQQFLDIQMSVGTVAMLVIFRDSDLFQESINWFIGYLQFIYEKINYLDEGIRDDLILLYQMISNIVGVDPKDQENLMNSLCYGACMFICALTEKILRVVHINMSKETKYISANEATLGALLSDGNMLFVEILGKYQLKHLRFFLCTDGEKSIGFNYRNNLAHWNSISPKQLNLFLVGKLMFLFTNVINSIFLYLYEESEKRQDQ